MSTLNAIAHDTTVDFWAAVRNSSATPELQAKKITNFTARQLRDHPKRCLLTVLDLEPGVDYPAPPSRKLRHQLDPETLQGVAKIVWDNCARFADRWIEQRLSSNGDELFAIVVHGKHDSKHLCGRFVARKVERDTLDHVLELRLKGIVPKLVVLYAGNSPDDTSYRHELLRHAARIGIVVEERQVPGEPTVKSVRDELHALNQRDDVHGVLVQTIRNAEITSVIRETLSSRKDPEYINSRHMGHVLFSEPNRPIEAPSTAMSCRELILEACGNDLKGKFVVIINGSAVIGRPLSVLLNNDGATTAVCNRYTGKKLLQLARMADVIVTATGKRGVINWRHVKKNAVIIDAAIIRDGEHIVGDVKVTPEMSRRMRKITPVPGGVGPVTVAMLLRATVQLATAHHHRARVIAA